MSKYSVLGALGAVTTEPDAIEQVKLELPIAGILVGMTQEEALELSVVLAAAVADVRDEEATG